MSEIAWVDVSDPRVPRDRHGIWAGYVEDTNIYAEARFEGLNANGVPRWHLTLYHVNGARRYVKNSYGACRREAEVQLRIDRKLAQK